MENFFRHRLRARQRQHVWKTGEREAAEAATPGVAAGDGVPGRGRGASREATYRLLVAIEHVLFGEEPHAVHQGHLGITPLAGAQAQVRGQRHQRAR